MFSADEDASFVCALDDEKAAPCASPVTYSDLAVGAHTFSVVATDLAGNAGEAVIRSWTIVPPPDTSPPDTSIDTAPPATTTEQSATFTFSASEEGSTFECTLDDGDFAACASPVDHVGLAIGAHTFAVRAIDAAGNVDPVPAVAQWTVLAPPDTTAPDTQIDDGPPSTTMSTSATFVFSSDDLAATFECALDDGAFAGCASPHDLAGVAVGSHTFWVRASDPAGQRRRHAGQLPVDGRAGTTTPAGRRNGAAHHDHRRSRPDDVGDDGHVHASSPTTRRPRSTAPSTTAPSRRARRRPPTADSPSAPTRSS